jgi:hypothetical protein
MVVAFKLLFQKTAFSPTKKTHQLQELMRF